ncbi:hypothetical protein BDBG_01276 [Blastomyces gilchristii SLH14081]|uniref:uncharacterized protein n=1 Tax=Blastomyces gilchristii (strain SLH14081) TaxID=559298 RepID=UPI0007DE474E|nr:uncharacterized protein BDBG_01276 [Blastomyces gilchristii SLH14081]OAT04779.1 hypothetical protein BDBG_01276 [Blastomyces gilchristii SLH14081]
MIHIITGTLLGLLFLATGARAQFQFFEQMFGGGQQQQESQEHNVPSDSSWYQRTYDNGVEDKFELGDGSAICVSKGGFKPGEAARKVELARKGLL